MKKFIFFLTALPLLLAAADIYMIGDSTMASYSEKRAPLTGWGMKMQEKCADGVKVYNRAISGRSTKSFYAHPKRWQQIMATIKPGDFVIIQFGHNDARGSKPGTKASAGHAPYATVYQEYLKKYVAEARAKGAIPVICSQTMLCDFNKNTGKPFNREPNCHYVTAAKKAAADANCDFVDLNAYALKHFEKIGKTAAEGLYMYLPKGVYPRYPNGRKDSCHLNAGGADFYAQAFVELAKKQNLAIAKLFK